MQNTRMIHAIHTQSAKSVYDTLVSDGGWPQEKRVGLDLMAVKESLQRTYDHLRWVPTRHMLADLLTKYMQGADGRPGYQRLFGKQVHEEGLEFGERVMYKLRPTKDMNVVLDALWQPGLWLGRT